MSGKLLPIVFLLGFSTLIMAAVLPIPSTIPQLQYTKYSDRIFPTLEIADKQNVDFVKTINEGLNEYHRQLEEVPLDYLDDKTLEEIENLQGEINDPVTLMNTLTRVILEQLFKLSFSSFYFSVKSLHSIEENLERIYGTIYKHQSILASKLNPAGRSVPYATTLFYGIQGGPIPRLSGLVYAEINRVTNPYCYRNLNNDDVISIDSTHSKICEEIKLRTEKLFDHDNDGYGPCKMTRSNQTRNLVCLDLFSKITGKPLTKEIEEMKIESKAEIGKLIQKSISEIIGFISAHKKSYYFPASVYIELREKESYVKYLGYEFETGQLRTAIELVLEAVKMQYQ